ncbi:unnamed protein product [Bemisia tabaci]|uniref:Chitin-binding type-2 domain-containing protein n=1 Tax=Bemisia tabaci TaxID=7038 RepID=A0A9P0ACS8_BEMTA|nr:unnamed protein product [Bemisia tabaci]
MISLLRTFFYCSFYITLCSAVPSRSRHRVERALYGNLRRNFNCDSEGFHSDPDDCTTFYRCIDWSKTDENAPRNRFTSFQFQCGPGTVFEPENESCVHPQLSSRDECRQLPPPIEAEPEPDNWGSQSEPQGPPQSQYGAPSNNDYYGNQQGSSNYGPSNYGEVPSSPGSEPSNNVDNLEEGAAPEPPMPVLNLPKCESEGFFPIEGDCSHFYRCVKNGESDRYDQYAFTCGEGTVFDPENNVCNYPSAVGRSDCKSSGSEWNNSPDNSGSQQPEAPYAPPGGYNNGHASPPQAPPSENIPPFEDTDERPIEFPGSNQPPPPNNANRPPPAAYPSRPSETSSGGQPGYPPQNRPTPSSPAPPPPSTPAPAAYPSRPSPEGGSNYGPPSPSSSPPRPSSTTPRPSYPNQPNPVSGGGYQPPARPPPSSSQVKPGNTTKQCKEEGFLPVEGNCTRFIRCVPRGSGFAEYDFECGEGTVWDTEQNTCNFPGSVQRPDCGLTTPYRPPTSTEPYNSSSVTYPDKESKPSQGGSYYSTTSTTKKPTTKPTTKATTTAKPAYPTRPSGGGGGSGYGPPAVTSPERPKTTTTTTTTSRPTYPSNQNPNAGGGYGPVSTTTTTRSPSTTTKPVYTTSSSYKPPTTTTQKPSTTARPAYPTQPSNSNGANPSYGSAAPSEPNSASSTCTSEGFFPVPEDCSKFIRCVSNGEGFTKYEFDCGPGTVWDPVNSVCNHPSAVENCGQMPVETNPQPETPNNSTTTSSTTPAQQPYPDRYPTRPAGSTGAPAYGQTSPTQQSYPDKYPTRPAGSTSAPPYGQTTGRPQGTTTKPPQTTTKYTKTTTAKPYPTEPSTSPKPVNGSTTPKPCNDTTKAPGPIKCEKAGFFPHPSDCKKFYRCVDWDGDKGERFSVFFFDCPNGTIFDPALDTCNYEASVYPPRDCNQGNQTTEEGTTKKPYQPTTQQPTSEYTNGTTGYSTESTTTREPYTTRESSTYYSTSEGTTESSTEYSSTKATEYSTVSSTPYDEQTEPTSESSSYSSTSTESVTESSTYSSTYPDYGSSSTYNPTSPTESSTYSSTGYTTDIYTTERTTEYGSTTETSTERVNQTCPDLKENQFAIACPTGFRRHPKSCGMFYQCTIAESSEIKVVVFSCPEGTIFDDAKVQCLEIDQTDECSGDSGSRLLKAVTDGSLPPIQITSKKELCPTEGNHPYENDCQLFYKCKKDSTGSTNGYLYQCPEGYSYWDVSKRCEKTTKMPSCDRGNALMKNDWRPTLAPLETGNIGS